MSLTDCAKGWHDNDGSDVCVRCGLDLNPAVENQNPDFVIDGHLFDDPESELDSDGEFAPFMIFMPRLQRHLPERYDTRAEAEAGLARNLAEAKSDRLNALGAAFMATRPELPANRLGKWIDDNIEVLSPAERATGHAILNQMWKVAFP